MKRPGTKIKFAQHFEQQRSAAIALNTMRFVLNWVNVKTSIIFTSLGILAFSVTFSQSHKCETNSLKAAANTLDDCLVFQSVRLAFRIGRQKLLSNVWFQFHSTKQFGSADEALSLADKTEQITCVWDGNRLPIIKAEIQLFSLNKRKATRN